MMRQKGGEIIIKKRESNNEKALFGVQVLAASAMKCAIKIFNTAKSETLCIQP